MSQFVSSPFMRAYAAGVRAGVPVVHVGNPGLAKTATIEGCAKAWGRHAETIIGSTRESTDFLGVMVEDKGVVKYSTFQWAQNLITASESLLFMDEFNTAAPSTMKGMLRVVQEGWVGDTKLPDTVSIVAAMNPVETAVDAYDLPAPMANRMMHLQWVFDTQTWLENVGTGFEHVTYPPLDQLLVADPITRKARVAGTITGFLKVRPNLLAPEPPKDPVKAGGAWPSPRSWTNAINVLSQLDQADDEAASLALTGLVGDGAATQFLLWKEQNDLYDPSAVLADPSIVDWKGERADRIFALIQAVTTLGLSKPELWRKASVALATCALAGKPDVALPGATKLASNIPGDGKTPAVFKDAFRELYTKTHYTVSAA
ncbi:AAA family ATPase [Arthrobacter sp. A2-55]|uniref:AAA family ATPase n=1 Tax=Arthrobacter sp. A2-55 TaxID=2897337 RepID=UPI0021CD7C46|nr:AAA family ATPase [Arthrobacter sp. A2-55]MCU6480134.1 AAA family ATPase [Arthrobacter sp. A2-55]